MTAEWTQIEIVLLKTRRKIQAGAGGRIVVVATLSGLILTTVLASEFKWSKFIGGVEVSGLAHFLRVGNDSQPVQTRHPDVNRVLDVGVRR
jgi:hypothetical protein